MRIGTLFVLALITLVPSAWSDSGEACSKEEPEGASLERLTASILGASDATLKTRDKPTNGKAEYHAVTYDLREYWRQLAYPAPFYLIGVEKLRPKVPIICRERSDQFCLDIDEYVGAFSGNEDSQRVATRHFPDHLQGFDWKRMFLTHIAFFGDDEESTCFLFNAYEEKNGSAACKEVRSQDEQDLKGDRLWRAGFAAMTENSAFATHLRNYAPSHIFLMSTGWNTSETKSLLRYKWWINSIESARPDTVSDWRPLYIGFAWQSKWGTGGRHASVFAKGNDADEVGLQWGNLALTRIVRPLAADIGAKLVLIGHSYGVRVVTEGTVRSALLGSRALPKVDVVVGLQPALSRNRFDYLDGCGFQLDCAPLFNWSEEVAVALLTCSVSDNALRTSDVLLGNCSSREELLGGRYPKYFRKTASKDGRVPGLALDDGNVYFVEAQFIGCHGDVYDEPVGRMIWSALGE